MNDNQFKSDEADDKKHAQSLSPQLSDEASAVGGMAEEPMDIDAMEKAFGRDNDDNGPDELSSD